MIAQGEPTQYIGMMPPNSRAPSTAMQSPDKPQIAQVQPDSLMAPAVHEEPRAANLLKMNRPDMACIMPSAIKAPDPALNNEKRTILPAPTQSNVCRGKASSQELCGREDSNLHGLRHTVLSRAPVPIRLRPQGKEKYTHVRCWP